MSEGGKLANPGLSLIERIKKTENLSLYQIGCALMVKLSGLLEHEKNIKSLI